MSTALTTLTTKLAKQFNIGDGSDLVSTLKATCFKSGTQVTDAQMTALLIVANQYGLNPFTREIYAFPDKGGIVPVVGLDGWSRIINSRPEFDGMDFAQDAESCTCTIYRKDRSHPIKVTEWMAECKRSAGPWLSHPYRMLRHKAMIQCARIAFGFAGIYDQDEAERIRDAIIRHIEKDLGPVSLPQVPLSPQPFTIAEYFPTPGVTAYHDPRQHAISLAFVVVVMGDCSPQQDALDLAWLTPTEACAVALTGDMTGGHGVLLRQAMAHLGFPI